VSDEFRDDDEFEMDAEVSERYPWLAGGDVDHGWGKQPPLEPKYQKILDLERKKLAAMNEITDGRRENYHYINELTDEHLPELDFLRYDNLFLARQANAFLVPADRESGPVRRLFSDLWLEGELSVLFADTGCGKSVLAMQIARALAGGERFEPFEMDVEPQRVAYFDFELTDEQFEKRYSSPDAPAQEPLFPANLIRCPARTLRELPPGVSDYYEFVTQSIFDLVLFLNAKFVIIDNITWLNSSIESSAAALRLMRMLVAIKNHLGISILVLAHTPKRYSRASLTIEHLHGSKMLSNFADSIFAMGLSRRGSEYRYLKGIKHRSAAARDVETEVATIHIGKTGRFLGFEFSGYTDERAHTGWHHGESNADRLAFVARVIELAGKNMTQRDIAKELGISASTVNRCLKFNEEEND